MTQATMTGRHEIQKTCSTCAYGRWVEEKHGIYCGRKKRKVNKVCDGWRR